MFLGMKILMYIILGHIEPKYQRPLRKKILYLSGLERMKMFAKLLKWP